MSGILGHLVNEKAGIIDNIEEKYLEFFVAGHTKQCKGMDVQINHRLLYSDSSMFSEIVDTKNKKRLWPFGKKTETDISVKLEKEPDNPSDPNAIMVKVSYPINLALLMAGHSTVFVDYYLGYVPKRITRVINKNLHLLEDGWIKKVIHYPQRKYCVTQVAFPYKVDVSNNNKMLVNRMAAALDIFDDNNDL